MNFIKYNLVLLVSGFPAIIIFSFGLVGCLAPLALFAKMERPPRIIVILLAFLVGAFQIYFWGLWSAYCVAVTYKFTMRPAVTWDWLYFVAGFFDASSLIGWLSYKEQQSVSYQRQTEIQKGTIYYAAFAWIAYIVFAIWPSLITPVYGWATDRLGLTKHINPIEWTEQDRLGEQQFRNAKKATDKLGDVMDKIGQPGVPQPNVSPAQMVAEFSATSIDVSKGDVTLYSHERVLLGLSCRSGPVGKLTGLKTISIGDTIKHEEYSFRVGIIEVTKFNEDLSSDGEIIAKKGEVVCVVAENEDALPSDKDCDALWLRIVNCQPFNK